MANKHVKRCSTSYVIRKMQINTTRYHYTKTKIRNTDTQCWEGCGATETVIHCWWECKIVQPLWKTVWQSFTELNILLSYNPTIELLGIFPNTVEHVDVYSRLNHNCQILEVIKMSFSR